MKIIDLRSDTVTRPSPAMRQAMANAEVGDDVFGDDPTVKELEHYIANLFGRGASLYVPSGTMANQICLKAISQRGWELLCDRECHIVNYECGGPAVHSGLLVNFITTERGMIPAPVVRASVRSKNLHHPETKIVALENSHNHHGGTILPQDEIREVRKVCDEFGLNLHLDGARIWNVHIATGLSLPELTSPFDQFTCCLSKGLGAPIGSMIVGSVDFIEKCRRERKLFGGAMRQVGIIAAAGLYAVKNNIPRMAEDHENARLFAEKLSLISMFGVDLGRIQTNIVIVNTKEPSAQVIEKMKQVGILAVSFGPFKVRFVTHLDVSRSDCEEVLERLQSIFE
jgi:threonine aldolase